MTITNLPLQTDQLEYVRICQDEILAVVPDKYLPPHFDKKRYRTPENDAPEIDLALLQDSPFILLKPGMQIRLVSEDLFQDAGISKPHIVPESENIGTLFELAVRGMASSLLHQSFIPRNHNGVYVEGHRHICFLRLNNPKAKSVLAAVYQKNRYLSKAAREFIDLTRELLASDRN